MMQMMGDMKSILSSNFGNISQSILDKHYDLGIVQTHSYNYKINTRYDTTLMYIHVLAMIIHHDLHVHDH